MIRVHEAATLIRETNLHLPVHQVSLLEAVGLAIQEPIRADRDFPPYDRVTMDGIALNYADWVNGGRDFKLSGVQFAGSPPLSYQGTGTCLEIMTGAVLPAGFDTVIRYEDVEIRQEGDQKYARITLPEFSQGLNVHHQGTDRKAGAELIPVGTRLGPAEVAVAATAGVSRVSVISLPKVAIISSGDELIPITDTPLPHQIRRSNSYMLQAALQSMGIESTRVHLPDDPQQIVQTLGKLLESHEILVLTGGVSKGKADHIPGAMDTLGIEKVFHRVSQRPGKPFWFGRNLDANRVVFALPGNPVSSFVGFCRYVKPWLLAQLGAGTIPPAYAELGSAFTFSPDLTYFLLVDAQITPTGRLRARPIPGSGSGDLANLLRCNGFLELPSNRSVFEQGEVFPFYRYRE